MALAALIVAVVAVTISLLSLAWTVGWSITRTDARHGQP